jgi:hypothetical protein
MNRWTRPLRPVVLLLAALVLGANPALAARSWVIMSAPDPDRGNNVLTDVTALSSSDAWAVGGFTPAVQHWTGSA